MIGSIPRINAPLSAAPPLWAIVRAVPEARRFAYHPDYGGQGRSCPCPRVVIVPPIPKVWSEGDTRTRGVFCRECERFLGALL